MLVKLTPRRDGISDDVNVESAVNKVNGGRNDANVSLDPAQDDRVDLGGHACLNNKHRAKVQSSGKQTQLMIGKL